MPSEPAAAAPSATLHFFCGKAGAGKTWYARELSDRTGALLISEDLWLSQLYPGEIQTFDHYLGRSRRFRQALEPLVVQLLRGGTDIVLDFAGNVPQERAWALGLSKAGRADHVLHWIDVTDEVCLHRVRRRNLLLPPGSKPISDDEFRAISRFFVPPVPTEGLRISVRSS